jgi:rubrerythrin
VNFLITAKGIEEEGIEFYSNLASNTTIKQLSGIFNFLAEEERRHLEIFTAMENKENIPVFDGMNIITKAKELFDTLSGQFETMETNSFDRIETYKKARELEDKSIAFYKSELEKIGNIEQADILHRIIREEEAHAALITSMLDFQQRPQEWLENAEWTHLEEY